MLDPTDATQLKFLPGATASYLTAGDVFWSLSRATVATVRTPPTVISFLGVPQSEVHEFGARVGRTPHVVTVDARDLRQTIDSGCPSAFDAKLASILGTIEGTPLTVISGCEALLSCEEGRRVLKLGDDYPRPYGSGNLCFLFESKNLDPRSFYANHARIERYRFFHVVPDRPSPPAPEELSLEIARLAAKHFGTYDAAVCQRFAAEIVDLARLPETPPTPSDRLRLIDPATGLPFLPEPATTYSAYIENNGRRLRPRDRDPLRFLHYAYERYLQHKLLYSGHLLKVDFKLYKALEYMAAKAGLPFMEFLAVNGVLTPQELEHPPPELKDKAGLLRAINGKFIIAGFSKGLLRARPNRPGSGPP
jgi:hypothetical protein